MTNRRPLVNINGTLSELPVGDGLTVPIASDSLSIVGAGGADVSSYLRVFQQDDGAGHAGGDVKLISNGWGQWSFNVDGNDLFLGAVGYTTFKSYHLGVRLTSKANAVLLQVNDNGNVGIGTTTPTVKLDVVGAIAATGTVTASNLSGTNTGDHKFTPPSYTWTDKPAAATFGIGYARITDVGANGSLWYSNGTRWVHDGPIVLATAFNKRLVPSLAATNAATYSQTGTTITVTSAAHTLTTAYNGADVYLSIGSGAAIAGWFTNFTYVGVDAFTCTSVVSQATSGIVNTGTSTRKLVEGISARIPAGLLGVGGSYEVKLSLLGTGAGTKYYSVHANTVEQEFWTVTSTTSRNVLITNITEATQFLQRNNAEGYSLSVTGGDFDSALETTIQPGLACRTTANHSICLVSFAVTVWPN